MDFEAYKVAVKLSLTETISAGHTTTIGKPGT